MRTEDCYRGGLVDRENMGTETLLLQITNSSLQL